ncbi:bifunctional demethylmenaquinone methyltransferase/2-methoxy-6-polyprenyl-1,4-benzoquinol methylase UbiE [Segetibacter sp. 3557_3]|uniref:bifunctional demethylmenaquinone methyltransferase/2-methoxy-6-polyprenyl-1,4-benzoquinol methylase UbiE n=1 Tax=Segetibacter sp. 3557_3 TaxID=2547429 RepID=UPI001058614D|nr:bifunctional demethylmenaquinone methyltransferase/2-methoxy-6-polyprenyl-1,4-benzoquinol methylase UbiE [Segetibacter sp. 3557_3]TDH23016.1 bifunctional demethylmenaquinone methyltransferase/2-methoxy-6-polyprenyl-1,4-benzoquinol methylase UbiE [Segetibacter sp. 3557_3]
MANYDHDKVVPDKSSLLGKKQQVAKMFDTIAFRYDFLNRFLSAGIDVSWRKKALKELKSIQPQRLLDVATGTGDVAILALEMLQPQKITGIDISEGMLELGRKKIDKLGANDRIELISGDSEGIPFNDATFDAVTVAFGVRNFENLEKGLKEMLRVLKPGGKLVVLEFSKPKQAAFKGIYNLYMNVVAPGFGSMIAKNKEAYEYLKESMLKFPEGQQFVQILDHSGYINTTCKPLTMGICSIYTGTKR